jgi:two-component system NtrC family sensor kinase
MCEFVNLQTANPSLEDVAFREGEEIDEIRKSIAKIEEHVERARKVVHNMLVYARKMEP